MAYTKEQKKSFKLWLKGSILVGAFGILTAWAVFPLAWKYRKKGRDSKFWWWMDDERIDENNSHGWENDYYSFIIRYGGDPYGKENFWIAYKWHRRNTVWNLKRDKYLAPSTQAEVGNNAIDVVEIVIDKLYKMTDEYKMIHIPQDGVWVASPGLKFLPTHPDEDIWQVNQGDTISFKTSIIGKGFMWFKPKEQDILLFRYGFCKIKTIRIFGKKIWQSWVTFKMGFGNKSYVFTLKMQKVKEWG